MQIQPIYQRTTNKIFYFFIFLLIVVLFFLVKFIVKSNKSLDDISYQEISEKIESFMIIQLCLPFIFSEFIRSDSEINNCIKSKISKSEQSKIFDYNEFSNFLLNNKDLQNEILKLIPQKKIKELCLNYYKKKHIQIVK